MQARNLTLVGIFTWLLIAVPSIVWERQHGTLMARQGITWMLAYTAFIVLFTLATHEKCERHQRVVFLLAETALALTCIALQPTSFQPILLVMIAGQLGGFSLPVAFGWTAAQSLALWFVSGDQNSFWVVFAYFAFQLFAIFSVRIAHQEHHARQALATANAELQVATGLLDINSRTEERLRIARDLHDVLGHHLTALSLNLEVAGHLSEGRVREEIEKSKALTKVLLTDVREVVSRLRHHDPVNLTAALHALRNVIDRPALTVEMSDVTIADPVAAQVALRAIQEIVTNAVRHSGARNLWLKIATEDHTLAIAARDDGAGTDHVAFGNGLRGMRERVEQLHGTMDVSSMRGHGFEVNLRIPLQESPA